VPVLAIVGAQWGDEGKGKITDLLADDADVVVRFGGGANAGHTVVNQHGEFRLHLVPSGIFNPSAISLIGTGTVVDFDLLTRELGVLRRQGVDLSGLRISNRAQVLMPYHIRLDRLQEEARGAGALGTTRRGIGPAYADKANRTGIQVGDLLQPDWLDERLRVVLEAKDRTLVREYGEPPIDAGSLLESAGAWGREYRDVIVDQVQLIAEALARGKRILLEGQLGAMRDLDWGTYPYVTSSTTIAGGGAVGGGVPARAIDRVLGVVKAYSTAVGAGPFPTELEGSDADGLRTIGGEYGATTGRPRRVGWFDAVAARYACRLNGFSGIAVTKLDVLDGFESIPVCTAYEIDGDIYDSVPTGGRLERAQPVYERVPGWQTPTGAVRAWDDLPPRARTYLERIEELAGAPIELVSVGPERDATIRRQS